MKRKIIEIQEDLCNGCELCVSACHEGAIEMVDGKARLVGDAYCDGLGDCLPECPTGAIQMIEREAEPFDEQLVQQKMQEDSPPCGCPGTASRTIERQTTNLAPQRTSEKAPEVDGQSSGAVPSELSQWPVQLHLVHPRAPYLQHQDLLIAADCTAFAYGNFHRDFIRGRITLIGCPKLDDPQHYQEKLTEIFHINQPSSITVVRMQVPCCGGMVQIVKQAMLEAKVIVPYQEVVIAADGSLV